MRKRSDKPALNQDSVMHKVSILLPVFNSERYLESTIDSVLAQTYQNWELLISDNCSQDATLAIAKAYAAKDKRIVFWQNETNVGVAGNYNKCIERSTGEYLELFGADDLFAPDCLGRLVHVLDNHPDVALATCARNLIDGNGTCSKVDRPFDGTRQLASDEVIRSNLSSLSNWIISPVMYRASLKGSGFDPGLKVWGDIDYWSRVLKGGDAYYVDEVLFSYRVHSDSETTRVFKDLEFVLDVIRMTDKHTTYIAGRDATADSFNRTVAEKLLDLARHAVDHRQANFHAVLAPFSDASKQPSTSDASYDRLAHDVHDYRRATCLALLHGNKLLKDRERLLRKWLDSMGRVKEMKEEISRLVANRDGLLIKRDTAVTERDVLKISADELKKEVQALREENKRLIAQFEANTKEQTVAQSSKLTAPIKKVTQKLFGGDN